MGSYKENVCSYKKDGDSYKGRRGEEGVLIRKKVILLYYSGFLIRNFGVLIRNRCVLIRKRVGSYKVL